MPGIFLDCAKPILDKKFPGLAYSAGLIGYGSDVLGYDDAVSTDHMWGPRFYLFLRQEDMEKRDAVMKAFSENLPYTYKGYSVNFSPPDPNDNGVRHPEYVETGNVHPLIFIDTFSDFLTERLGTADLDRIQPLDWLAFSEHRLLSLVSGQFWIDRLQLEDRLTAVRFYPPEVKRYLIASHWDMIASEQAFMKRCGSCGDEIGSMLVAARIAEHLMRLCFLYKDTYAPYSKWFGTAFLHLPIDGSIQSALHGSLYGASLTAREDSLVTAQALVAALHNQSGITPPVPFTIQPYFNRDIKVIYADRFSAAVSETLKETAFENLPLIGSFSAVSSWSELSDDPESWNKIRNFYRSNLWPFPPHPFPFVSLYKPMKALLTKTPKCAFSP